MEENNSFLTYVPLHQHTWYSFMDAYGSPKKVAERAKELGLKAIAITEHGHCYSFVQFYEAVKEQGLKPIIGMEAYISPLELPDRKCKIRNHMVLLAKNKAGLKTLFELSSYSFKHGFYYKPRMDKKILKELNKDKNLIATTACMGGVLGAPYLFRKDGLSGEEAIKKGCELPPCTDEYLDNEIKDFVEIFGKENFYLEIQNRPEMPKQVELNKKLIELSKKHDLPLVAGLDSHYILKGEEELREIIKGVKKKKDTDADFTELSSAEKREKNIKVEEEGEYHLPEPQEYYENFVKEWGEYGHQAIENGIKISERIEDVDILDQGYILPKFPVPEGETAESVLKDLCMKGIDKRYKTEEKKVKAKERVEYELGVILEMGFPDYFLIVRDFVVWAKEQGIAVWPGRGSAAGSIISYLVDITEVDPLEWDLSFERFLNPSRVSMPDIDIDIEKGRRNEVVNYIRNRWGNDKAMQICTYNTLAGRAALKDVFRYERDMKNNERFQFTFANQLSRFLNEKDVKARSLPEILQEPVQKDNPNNSDPGLAQYRDDPEIKKAFELAEKLRDCPRNVSIHACAMVVSDKPIYEYCPYQLVDGKDEDGKKLTGEDNKIEVTQLDMYDVEKLGLLKIDVLGLDALDLIYNTFRLVKQVFGEDISLPQIPLDDKKTFDLLGTGNCLGVFQLRGEGIQKTIKNLKPKTISDVADFLALYRPWPIQFLDQYISSKHNNKIEPSAHDIIDDLTKETGGILIYQEQIMKLAVLMAGYTPAESDDLRKAMAKQKKDKMLIHEKKFIQGAKEHSNIDEEKGQQIWEYIQPFGSYGFNKSHSVSYAYLTYYTAYLKAHYPALFMSSFLKSQAKSQELIHRIYLECTKRLGINIYAPSINESMATFTANKNKEIYWGLNAIKGLDKASVTIVEEREKNGKYKSLRDFLIRTIEGSINKRVLEALILTDTLREFGSKEMLMKNFETILDFQKKIKNQIKNKEKQEAKNKDNLSLFGEKTMEELNEGKNFDNIPFNLEDTNEKFTFSKKLEHQMEYFGVVVDYGNAPSLLTTSYNIRGFGKLSATKLNIELEDVFKRNTKFKKFLKLKGDTICNPVMYTGFVKEIDFRNSPKGSYAVVTLCDTDWNSQTFWVYDKELAHTLSENMVKSYTHVITFITTVYMNDYNENIQYRTKVKKMDLKKIPENV